MKEKSLKDLRAALQKKDAEIVGLLNERAALSIEVGRLKQSEKREVYDPSRESRIYSYLDEMNAGPLPERALKEIYREILSSSRSLQEPITVAYLGPEASFSHSAALSHFGGSARLLPQKSISLVFDEVEKGRAGQGIVPVENTSGGSVKPTLDRLVSTTLNIRAEYFLPVSHSLLARFKGMKKIKRVYSHPQVFAQCQGWLARHLPLASLIETGSTSGAARQALTDEEGAAIGSRLAAVTYGLHVLVEGIEDNPGNMTRFIVVGKGESQRTGKDKTSVLFGTRHEPGSLYHAMEPFARERINLMRIESHPMKDQMWEYIFFVDFAGHKEEEKIKKCLKVLQKKATLVKMLGSYPVGDASL